MKLVRRAQSQDDVKQRLTELKAALEEEGVPPGGQYWVSGAAPNLNGHGAHRNTDADTARQAALNPGLDRAASRKAVLQALAHLVEATSREVAEHLGWDRSQVSPRLNELGPGAPTVRYDPPLVQKTGRTRAGLGPGVQNETWELTDAGRAALSL